MRARAAHKKNSNRAILVSIYRPYVCVRVLNAKHCQQHIFHERTLIVFICFPTGSKWKDLRSKMVMNAGWGREIVIFFYQCDSLVALFEAFIRQKQWQQERNETVSMSFELFLHFVTGSTTTK